MAACYDEGDAMMAIRLNQNRDGSPTGAVWAPSLSGRPESLHPDGMREHELRLWPALTSHGHESKWRPGTTFILSCSEHAVQQTSSLNRITGAFTSNKTSFIRQLWSFAINLCKNTTEPLHIKTFLSFYRWNIFANTRYRYTAVPNLIINGPLHWFINVGLFKTVGN